MTRRPYMRPMPKSWWLHQRRYINYMIRELTCLFVGLHAIILIAGIYSLSRGQEAFEGFLASLWGPTGVFISLVILLMGIIHSATWFNLTPKAMPIWIGEKKLPGWIIVGGHYGGWVIISAVIFFLARGWV